MIIIYALCNSNKSISGYGVYNFEEIQEYSIEDTSVLIQTGEIDNAVLNKGVITLTNCTSVLPTFYNKDYSPLYPRCPIYVVCRCTQNDVEGYLILNPECELQFVTRTELVATCQTHIVTNVKLKQMLRANKLFPVQVKIPFKHIGEVELED